MTKKKSKIVDVAKKLSDSVDSVEFQQKTMDLAMKMGQICDGEDMEVVFAATAVIGIYAKQNIENKAQTKFSIGKQEEQYTKTKISPDIERFYAG